MQREKVMINQTFYSKECQSYGTECFSRVGEMIDYLSWKKIVQYLNLNK